MSEPQDAAAASGAGPAGSWSVIDVSVIADLCELEVASKEPFLAPLVDAFFEDAPRRIARLVEALAKGDAPGVELQAHSLKGSAGALGIVVVDAIAADIEASAKVGHLGEVGDSVQRLRAAVSSAEPVIRDALARGVGTQYERSTEAGIGGAKEVRAR